MLALAGLISSGPPSTTVVEFQSHNSGLFLVLGLMHLTWLVIDTRNADRHGSGQDGRRFPSQGQKDS